MNPLTFLRQRVANLTLARKFVVLCTLLALGVVLLAVAAARLQYLDLIEARKQSVKTQVEMGMTVMQYYAGKAKRGELTPEAAQDAARSTLAGMSSNGGVDYFFIIDPKLRIVMHPKRAVGTDMSDYKSDAGEYVYRDIGQAVTHGNGFSYYSAPKPGKKEQLPKISYAQAFPDWNWTLVMGVYAEDIQAQAWGFTKLLTLIGAGVVVLVVALCWLIATAVRTPLIAATRTAEAIAAGRFDNAIRVESRDETGQLMTSMQQMQTQLQRFNGEMQTMIRLQHGEDIAHRMPEDFPGDYGTLAHGVNTVLFEHLDGIAEAMDIMGDYGRGDLRRDMRRLPGQRAALHEALDTVKTNLSAINGDIARMAEAAARGDFSVRGDQGSYQFAFAEMVQALNQLMCQAEAGLADVGRIMDAIADGDLSQRVDARYQGAFGRLAAATNRTAIQLTEIVQGIQHSAQSINTAASEIATGNADLSVRTEQQAANLEETAASMEELTSTVRQNAEHARQANQLAAGAGTVAESGGRVVEDVVTTMASISAASARIADIIGVIDGIA
ncbi:HAMP domain-containing protein, partial [Xanthomonas sp. Kuri4-1]